MSLKEKVDGKELDLSLNQLTEVPVKELAAATKATMLDLSCNRIRSLPREFATLTHLVKIDLSTNNLIELPDNFGNLHNLQYLDLYSNQIENLPISFCRLKNLRWLDLKNNPLDGKLKAIAGDCLDQKECQDCAKKVVIYMQTIDSELEREKQKKLKDFREREAIKRAIKEKELLEQRNLKKLEREKRKAKAKREAQLLLEGEKLIENENNSRLDGNTGTDDLEQHSTKGKYFFAKIFLFITLFFCSLLLYILWSNDWSSVSSIDFKVSMIHIQRNRKICVDQVLKFVKTYSPLLREYLLKIVHNYLTLTTYCATQVEQILSKYY